MKRDAIHRPMPFFHELRQLEMSVRLLIVAALGASSSAWADQLGQGPWCWVAAHSETMFCDYVSYDSCRDANRGKDGVCVPRTH